MKKNVVILLIDCLSKWYIDQIKTEESFFGKLEKNSYCCNQMYSGAPFTEGAMGELFASEETLKNVNYLSKCREFSNDPFYKIFKENGYYVYLNEVPYTNYVRYGDNHYSDEATYKMAALSQYFYVFQVFINLREQGAFLEKDIWKLQYALERYFEEFNWVHTVKEEEGKYKKNKKVYVDDLLDNKEKSSFVIHCMMPDIDTNLTNRRQTELRTLLEEPIGDVEAAFLSKMKYKNLEYLLETQRESGEINAEITGSLYNRDIHCEHYEVPYNRYPVLEQEKMLSGGKKIQEDLEDFINWYDHEGRQLDKPFIAYIHSMHCHSRDVVVDSYYRDRKTYLKELNELTEHINELQWQKMSVWKQLMIKKLEKHLETFWKELETRNLFDNSIIILTADHGLHNFLLHGTGTHWNYRRTTFNIPFYMTGKGINNQEDDRLKSARDILPTLIDECNLETGLNQYIGKNVKCSGADSLYSAWVNGRPDFDRYRVTCGIRNEQYSITCILHPTQFLMTGEIMGIYDLQNDPDECNNLAPNISTLELEKLFNTLKDSWFDTVLMILTDQASQWGFYKKYGFLKEKEEYYRNINRELKKENWDKLEEIVEGKEIIIFGAGLHTEKLLTDKRFTYPVKEIWDNDTRKAGTYMLGNRIALPNYQKITENTFIIITSRFEFEIVEQLENMGVTQYTFGGLYINGFLRES